MEMKKHLRTALYLFLVVALLSGCSGQVNAKSTGTGSAQGFEGEVTVTVEVENGKITSVKAVGDHETQGVGSKAIAQMPDAMVKANSVEVDGVTGATFSSQAVLTAARAAYAQATGEKLNAAVKMKPGAYTGSAVGFRTAWTIAATVKVSEDKILSIDVAKDSADTVGIFDSAVDLLVPRIIKNQSVGVDAITGATASSNGIKGAVTNALKAALKAGGSDASAIQAFQTIPEKSKKTQVLNTKVLVVGLGGSGVSAALKAAETMHEADPKSVDVLAIDKAGRFGGTSSLTSGFFAVNPKKFEQEHNQGKDYVNKEEMLNDWISFTHGDAKKDMIQLLLNESGNTLDWMVYNYGLQMTPPKGGLVAGDDLTVCFSYSPSNKGIHNRRVNNLTFFKNCMDTYEKLGGKYMLETNGYELIYDQKSNTVKGVKARNDDGTEYEIHADSVILATGGFAGNGDMEKKYLSDAYFPLKDSWSQVGMKQCTGEMIESAIGIGANTYSIGMCPAVHIIGTAGYLTNFKYHVTNDYQSSTNKPLVWTEGDLPLYMGSAGNSLAVNTKGERFLNEAVGMNFNAWVSGPTFYSIYSAEQIQDIADNGLKFPGGFQPNFGAVGNIPVKMPIPSAFDVMDAAVDAGFMYKADTLAELAKALGMDANVLENTVNTYNKSCEAGVDKAFGKSAKYLDKLGKGPYYAIVMRNYCYCTCGGLDIDNQMRVLDTKGNVINGLYAVGMDSSGVLFSERAPYVTYGGVCQGWAYTSGRLAGEIAAKASA